jgi:hypothetical protein
MALKNKRKWIFLSILIAVLGVGIAFAGNWTIYGHGEKSDVDIDCLGRHYKKLKIVNVWSYDGSPISSPPTPPEKDIFLPQENIYAVIKTVGIGVKTVRIYMVANDSWRKHAPLIDVSSDGYNEITINATKSPQYHGPYLIWEAPLKIGNYDIVVDENLNGVRDHHERVDDSRIVPGVFVIQDLPLGSIMATVSSFAAMTVFSRRFKAR